MSFVLKDGTTVSGQHITPSLVDLVDRVLIFLRSSKTDQVGKGYTFVLYVVDNDMSDTGRVIALWAAHNKLEVDRPFFASFNCPGKRHWCITASHIHTTIRAIARQWGFLPDEVRKFTTHSLRYGGASTLNEAKVSRRRIKFAGRWKSDAFETYCQHSHKLFRSTQKVLRDPNILSVKKVLEVARTRR